MAEWLDLGMRQSGLSQTALADKAGVSRATVNRLAQQRQDAEQATIKRLAKAMKYPFPDIDVVFPEAERGGGERYSSGSSRGTRGLTVREPGPGGDLDDDAAYLQFALMMTRQLAAAEREGATTQALLRLVDLAEAVAVPIHGTRAKKFLDDERRRIQRGETLDGGGASTGS